MRTPCFQRDTGSGEVVFVSPEERTHFVDFLLVTDLALRRPPRLTTTPPVETSGKNPDDPMTGVWISYYRPPSKERGKAGNRRGKAYVHSSDESIRKFVALQALIDGELSVTKAAAEVGVRVGESTDQEIAAIRSLYYKFHHPFRDQLLSNYVGFFRLWKWSVLESAALDASYPLPGRGRLEFIADKVREKNGGRAAAQFQDLVGRIVAESSPLNLEQVRASNPFQPCWGEQNFCTTARFPVMMDGDTAC